MTNREKYILSIYEELSDMGKHENVKLVKNTVNDGIYIKKTLKNYNIEIYKILKNRQIKGIPKVYEIIEDEKELIIIEEYIHGLTLDKKYNKTDVETVKKIMEQLCNILKQLHNMNPPIIHRDIKPTNIMVSNDDVVYLVDFNISREYDENQSVDTVIMGTQGYASPEQCGFAQTDCRSDIYSIGMLMKNILMVDEYPDKETKRLKRIIDKCTSIDPGKRYKNIEKLEQALNNKLGERISLQCNETDEKIKQSFLPPGFRGGKIANMLIALAGYASMISLAMAIESSSSNPAVKAKEDIVFKIIMLITELVTVAIYFNWRGIRDKLPIVKEKNMLIRLIGFAIYPVTILVLLIVVALIILYIVSYKCKVTLSLVLFA